MVWGMLHQTPARIWTTLSMAYAKRFLAGSLANLNDTHAIHIAGLPICAMIAGILI